MDIGKLSLADLFGKFRVRTVDLFIERHVEKLAMRRDADTHTLGADPLHDRIDHLKDETQPVADRVSGVAIGSIIDKRVHELLQQVPVCSMNFYAVEACFDRVLGSLCKLFHDSSDLACFELTRGGRFNEAMLSLVVISKSRCTHCALRRSTHRQLPVLKDRRM